MSSFEPVVLHRIGLKGFLAALHRAPSLTGCGTYLGAHRGQICSLPEIIAWVYADREDGGPDFPEDTLRVLIARLRRQGAKIDTHRMRGYRMLV